jgi:hypothetical protein
MLPQARGLNEALQGAQSLFLLTGDMPEQTQAELRIVEAAARAASPILSNSLHGARKPKISRLLVSIGLLNEPSKHPA